MSDMWERHRKAAQEGLESHLAGPSDPGLVEAWEKLEADRQMAREELAAMRDEYGDQATPYEKDYVRLQSEVERLRDEALVFEAKYRKMQAEAERLRARVAELEAVLDALHEGTTKGGSCSPSEDS